MVDIIRMLDISTGHLSKETRRWLKKTNLLNGDGPSGAKHTYGWFLYAHDDNCCNSTAPNAPEGEFPPDLWAIFRFARKNRCDYVKIDEDASRYEEFPWFEKE